MSRRYKSFLQDENAKLPRTTAWRRAKMQEDIGQTDPTNNLELRANSENERSSVFLSGLDDSYLNIDDEGEDSFTDEAEAIRTERCADVARDDRAIYPGSNVTKAQALALTIAFAMRHQQNLRARQDLLKLINTLVPDCVPRSEYLLNKIFINESDPGCEVHVYCPQCSSYLGQTSTNCEHCSINIDREKCISDGSYMLVLPLKTQLKDLFEHTDLFSTLDKRERKCDSVSNICDGVLYHNVKLHDFISCDSNCSLSWSCDGVPVFKSSNYSIWPLFCSINELPLPERRKYILLTALWFGPSKPRMDTFLKCFVNEAKLLYNDGLCWTNVRGEVIETKIATLVCVCDAPARAMVQNFAQFNGAFGCGFCKHEGIVVAKGRGHSRVYPVRKNLPCQRSREETIHLAERALSVGQNQLGVKGPSLIMLIPNFDIIQGFVPDYMHSVLLGVARYFVNLWLDSSSHAARYYIRDCTAIDNMLIALRPPKEIRRLPRPLKQRKFWKASEWRSFLLFYSPFVLFQYMDPVYMNHWMLLVFAVNLLMQKSIPKSDLVKAKLAFVKFAIDTEELYGIEHVTYNVHILQHLVSSVENWGPLTSNSAFLYEDAAGSLLRMFSGTRNVPHQMMKFYSALRNLQRVGKVWIENANEEVCNLFSHFIDSSDSLSVRSAYKVDDVVALGVPVVQHLTAQEISLVEDSLGCRVYNSDSAFFQRIIVDKHVLTTFEYTSNYRRDDSLCYVKPGDYCRIISIAIIRLCCCACDEECVCEGKYEKMVCFVSKFKRWHKQPILHDAFVEDNLNRIFLKCNLDKEKYVICCNEIVGKGFVFQSQNVFYVIPIPQFELD